MSWAEKYQRVRRKCRQCGVMFGTHRKTQATCSNRCAIHARGPEWWEAHQAKCTATRKANGYSRFVQRMRAAGLNDLQIHAVRKEIAIVRAAAHTSGKRLGWAQALGEHAGNLADRYRRQGRTA